MKINNKTLDSRLVQTRLTDSISNPTLVSGKSKLELDSSCQLERDGYASRVRDKLQFRFGLEIG